jgi:hypothetical protein
MQHEPKSRTAVDAALSTTTGGQAHPSGAKLHTGPTAEAAASQLNAAAFTAGSNVYFGAGQSPSNRGLLAHELAHVEQTRGLAAPVAGNYTVSDPRGAAEANAKTAESGGAAGGGGAGATIYRSLLADAGNALVDGAMKAAGADKLEDFLNSLAAGDAAAAKTKWAAVGGQIKPTMRTASALMSVVGHYPGGLKADPIESVIDVMKADALPIMKETATAFDKVAYADDILGLAGGIDAPTWLGALKTAGLFDAWLAKLPAHAALTDARVHKLDPWMQATATVADARKVFEHAYPQLKDTAYTATMKATRWEIGDIKRLWTALASRLPLAHVNTISGGFNLGTDEKIWHASFTALGFGWHDPGVNMIVMPKASSVAGGNGTGHDMTGGDNSGVVAAGTAADPKLSHWDGTVLHEVGHGVGSRTDGNTFAQSHGDWQGSQAVDSWSKNLFDDAAATAALPTPAPHKILRAADARLFLAADIVKPGSGALPAGWRRPDVEQFITAHYSAQKLVGYWGKRKSGTAEYYADADNFSGGRTYVWLSRGGLDYTSYKKAITDNKVSWYSLSSTVEWFAEQYANYYRTGKTGAGTDAPTKTKLDAIDKMDATATGGLKGAGATVTPGSDGKGGAGSSAGSGPAAEVDITAVAIRARVHRMNF